MLTTNEHGKTYTTIEAVDLIEKENEVFINKRDGLIMYMSRPTTYLDADGKTKGTLKKIVLLDAETKAMKKAELVLSQIKYKLWQLYTNDDDKVEKYEGTMPQTSTGQNYAIQYLDYSKARNLVLSQNKQVIAVNENTLYVRKDLPVIYQDGDAKRVNLSKPFAAFTDFEGNEQPSISANLLEGQQFIESYVNLATMQVGRVNIL